MQSNKFCERAGLPVMIIFQPAQFALPFMTYDLHGFAPGQENENDGPLLAAGDSGCQLVRAPTCLIRKNVWPLRQVMLASAQHIN